MYIGIKKKNCVKWSNYLSDTLSVSNGIKQGGILSPMLFNIYVDDLSTALNRCNVGCCFNAIVLNHLYYADDLCLLSPSVNELNKLLSISAKYTTGHDIVIDECKSECLYFKPMQFKIKLVNSIYLNGVRIKIDRHCKYLGHIVSDNLSDNRDNNRQLR